MNRILFYSLIIIVLPLQTFAQKGFRNPKLKLGEVVIMEKTIQFHYEVPYPGTVELELYNEIGDFIGITSSVAKTPGDHFIAINKKKLKQLGSYTFNLNYKGNPIGGFFKLE